LFKATETFDSGFTRKLIGDAGTNALPLIVLTVNEEILAVVKVETVLKLAEPPVPNKAV
jgi:hypothetical protein